MNVDTKLFLWLHAFANRSKHTDALIVFTASYVAYILAAAFPLYLLLIGVSFGRMLVLAGSAFLATLIARFTFVSLIRFSRPIPRPFLTHPIKSLFVITAPSFPSGHSAFFFALAMSVFFYNTSLGIIFFVATTLMTIGRVIAGVHYPSDILAGAVIGVSSAFLTYAYLIPLLASLIR